MLVRLIIIVALVSIAIFVYRKLTAPKTTQPNKQEGATMRKCAQCGVHLPESEAIKEDAHFFCSEDHKRAYLTDHGDSDRNDD